MSLFQKIVSRSRTRAARRQLADSATAQNYASLVNEHARLSEWGRAMQVCEEGLALFPGNPELSRLERRVRELEREGRTRNLARELREGPRPALFRELCELSIEAGRFQRAEEVAQDWFEHDQDGEAVLYRARARAERFFADRRREDGRTAFDLLIEAERQLGRDQRPLRQHLELAMRIGAWREARRVCSKLLEILPGDPDLEARFRRLMGLSSTAPTLDEALREVEKTGRLADDKSDDQGPQRAPSQGSIRPMLQELVDQKGAEGALYERGATVLIQGPKGATAERHARAVRDVVTRTRTAARRLGLGQAFEVSVEGSFGSLLVSPDDHGAAALWSTSQIQPAQYAALFELAGAALNRHAEEQA